ncbi:hypothetical protein [Robertmurraya andreesenii]|uniref:Uncharacterized protein n=1 Tax=Anoxybacillus andreesenii TaxID=1325932 RepID=A0ABT9V1Z5_9BACL|nr:hypothetical protein [Robertmurraya andreesenii]MDQ0154936.1 hypothetical protein [Robertmurraya andreesenii]
MAKVISFNERLAAKKESKKDGELKEFFLTQILPYLTRGEKLAIVKAMEEGDAKTYFEITEPILRRNALYEANR